MKLSILISIVVSFTVPSEGSVLFHLVPAEIQKTLNKNQKKIVGAALDSTAFLGASVGAMAAAQQVGQLVG
jgi:hypothetical protein